MPTKKYDEIEVTAWNVKHFTDYLVAEHRRIFGVDYRPMGGWQVERGMIGNIIGTSKKAGTHDKALIKRFIDVCFAEYKPSAQYPGTSFGFSWTWRSNVLQRLQAEEARKVTASDAVKASDNDKLDELEAWL